MSTALQCDGCGLIAQLGSKSLPGGWAALTLENSDARHLCPQCVEKMSAVLKAKDKDK